MWQTITSPNITPFTSISVYDENMAIAASGQNLYQWDGMEWEKVAGNYADSLRQPQ